MSPAAVRERIAQALEGIDHETAEPRDGMPALLVSPAVLHDVLARLRDTAGFVAATFVTAIDRTPREPRFDLVHQLWSPDHADRVRVTTRVADGEEVPTCTDLWPGAAFMERECFDMFGIRFAGHAGLKRLLMPEGYGHHPLRKEFPHQGIEPDRLYREWDAERRRGWETAGEDRS